MKHLLLTTFLLCMTTVMSFAGESPDNIQIGEHSLQELQNGCQGPKSWLYARYSAGLGKGTIVLECPSPVVVDERIPKVVVRYIAPDCGIAPGGKVTVWLPQGSWKPQTEDPTQYSYLSVNAAGKPVDVSIDYTWNFRYQKAYANEGHKKLVTVYLPDGLAAGKTVEYTWTEVYTGRFARRFEGERFLFRMYADHDADGWEEELPQLAYVPLISQPANRFAIRTQSMAVVGEPVRLTMMALSPLHNPDVSYKGTVTFSADGAGISLPADYGFRETDNGARTFYATFGKPGVYWVRVTDDASGITGESNPIEIFAEEPEYRLYWGDLHVHTELSGDAFNGAHTLTTYPGSYDIGRYRYGMDFMANTDHHGINSYSERDWEFMTAATNEANDPGKFVTLLAIEASHSKGDQNVYFRGDEMPYLNYDGQNHPDDLWAQLRKFETFIVPHHFAQSMRPWQWQNYDERLMKVAEIYSNHGRGEFFGNEPHYSWHPGPTLEGQTWQDQLALGKKLGAIAASDDHWSRPGYSGLAGVWAKTLERGAIYDSIKARHCYAVTNARTVLHLSVNGKEMGSAIKHSKHAEFDIRAYAPSDILEAVIIKNGDIVHSASADGRTITFNWSDPESPKGAYYYVRIQTAARPNAEDLLADKPEYAWSSPVWFE